VNQTYSDWDEPDEMNMHRLRILTVVIVDVNVLIITCYLRWTIGVISKNLNKFVTTNLNS